MDTNEMIENLEKTLSEEIDKAKTEMAEKLKKTASEEIDKTKMEMAEKLMKTVIEEMEKAMNEMAEKLKNAVIEDMEKAMKEMAEKLKKTLSEGIEKAMKEMAEKLKKTVIEEMEKAMKELAETLKKTVCEVIEKAKKEMGEELKKAVFEEIEEAMKEMAEKLKKTLSEGIEEAVKEIEMEMAEKLEKTVIDKMEKAMMEMMEEKRRELEELDDLERILLIAVRESKAEIHEARKELIKALRDSSGCESCKIGVKMMGDLDEKPFLKACKKRFSGKEAEMQSAMLCSKWEENLKNPSWHPFKRVWAGDNVKEVVDEEDEKLRNLREEWGEEVMNAVKTAHEELNDYNASGRYSVPALWNYEEGREATLKEGISHMANQINTLKLKHT